MIMKLFRSNHHLSVVLIAVVKGHEQALLHCTAARSYYCGSVKVQVRAASPVDDPTAENMPTMVM
jgi:hypothetical protein